jgi:hypothetical protein
LSRGFPLARLTTLIGTTCPMRTGGSMFAGYFTDFDHRGNRPFAGLAVWIRRGGQQIVRQDSKPAAPTWYPTFNGAFYREVQLADAARRDRAVRGASRHLRRLSSSSQRSSAISSSSSIWA